MDLLDRFGHSWWLYVQMAFTLGMLFHAYRSGAEQIWFWVILFFQPFGSWAYFFIVFLRSFRFSRGVSTGPLWQKKLSLAELRYRAERTPTVVNRMALAQRLMEQGQYADAIPLLEAVMAADDIYCQPKHDLAVCHLAGHEPAKAVALVKQLLQRDYRWSNYLAWCTLIEAHLACHDPQAALQACRELTKMVPTLENKCHLAEHLLDNKLHSEAIDLLDGALEDHAYTPFAKRLQNWRWARTAQRLLKEAETKTKP
jgi:hypothetical protein